MSTPISGNNFKLVSQSWNSHRNFLEASPGFLDAIFQARHSYLPIYPYFDIVYCQSDTLLKLVDVSHNMWKLQQKRCDRSMNANLTHLQSSDCTIPLLRLLNLGHNRCICTCEISFCEMNFFMVQFQCHSSYDYDGIRRRGRTPTTASVAIKRIVLASHITYARNSALCYTYTFRRKLFVQGSGYIAYI